MDKQQIKARFFGQHIGGRVRIAGSIVCADGDYTLSGVSFWSKMSVELENVDCKVWAFDCKLVLRPLSDISKSELIELLTIANYFDPEWCADYYLSEEFSGRDWLNIALTNKKSNDVIFHVIDYLRSINICVPFMGLDPIAEDWVILEEKIPANAQKEAKKEEKS